MVPALCTAPSSISAQRLRWSWPRGLTPLWVNTAQSRAGPPTWCAARSSRPSASMSPKPSLLVIIWSRVLAASASPHLGSSPPSCSLVRYPFSKHSITQPITQPNSLTSTPALSTWVLSHCTSTGSTQPICAPQPDSPSYSDSSMRVPLCSPDGITFMWQCCIPHPLHWWPLCANCARRFVGCHSSSPLWLGEDVGGVVLGGQCARKGAAVHTAEGSEPIEVG